MKFLHSMIRVSDPDSTVAFFQLLGLVERRRMENEQGRYTLIFLGVPGDEGGEVEPAGARHRRLDDRVLGPDQVDEPSIGPAYHSPLLGIDAQGSAGGRAAPC